MQQLQSWQAILIYMHLNSCEQSNALLMGRSSHMYVPRTDHTHK